MKKLYIFTLLSILGIGMQAQQVIEIQPLFEYTTPPEEIESVQERCDYIVKNFWNNFNFKNTSPVDQYALNEAFNVYSSAFQFANPKEIEASVLKLNKNISSNPSLQLQFCKAAEENLYGLRAPMWRDDIYMLFLDALIKNKKIPENRKSKYLRQYTALKESAIGTLAPTFWFEDRERASKQYFPMSTPTILIFGTPYDTDWRLSRLKMESNFRLEDALDKGKVNILYIVTSPSDNWKEETSNYNKHWTVGISEDVNNHFDIKMNPSIYVIDSTGKIIAKNILPSQSVDLVLDLVK